MSQTVKSEGSTAVLAKTSMFGHRPVLRPHTDSQREHGGTYDRRRTRQLLLRAFAGIGSIIGLWSAIVAIFDVQPWVMPSPLPTLQTLIDERSTIWSHSVVTVAGSFAGLAFSTVFAVSLAMLFVSSPMTQRALLPVAIVLRSIPIVAVAPLITLFAGRGLRTSIICVTVVSFFPLLVYTAKGFRSTTSEMRELMRVSGASRLQVFRFASFPTALPFLFAGLRSASAVAVLGALLAEWLTGVQGLGTLLTMAAALRDTELLWAVVIVATLLSLIIFWTMQALERAVLAWSRGER